MAVAHSAFLRFSSGMTQLLSWSNAIISYGFKQIGSYVKYFFIALILYELSAKVNGPLLKLWQTRFRFINWIIGLRISTQTNF